MEISQKKLKNKTTIWPSNSTLGYVSEKKNQKTKTTNLKRYMHTIVIAALFIIAKVFKQPKCPSVDGWIKKMWCICAIECYSEKNEI